MMHSWPEHVTSSKCVFVELELSLICFGESIMTYQTKRIKNKVLVFIVLRVRGEKSHKHMMGKPKGFDPSEA